MRNPPSPGLGARPANRRHASGFTLVEMLVVIGIILIISSLVVPAFNAISGGKDVQNTAWEVSGLLDQARGYAMAENTHVWVGLQQESEAVLVGVVASRDGSGADPNQPALDPANLTQIHNGLTLENVELKDGLPPYGGRPVGTAEGVTDVATATSAISFQARVGGVDRTFTGSVVEFKPSGESRIAGESLARWLEIGLQPTRGGVATGDNSAVVQIAGVSGHTRIFRP